MRALGWQAQVRIATARALRSVHRFLPPWLVLLLSLFATLIVWQMTIEQNRESARLRFAFEVQQIEEQIQQRLSLHESALRGARGHLADNALITERDWQRYVQNLGVRQRYPGLDPIGLAMRVTEEDRALYVRTMHALGRKDYQIRPDGTRPVYFPVTYIEPTRDGLDTLIGFDLWSDPVRREAMQRAAEGGQMTVTGRAHLLTGGSDAQRGFVMFLPVYAGGGVPATADQRETRLVAFVFSPYTMAQFLGGMFVDQRPGVLSMRVYEGARHGALMYESANAARGNGKPRFRRSDTIDMGGVQWTLDFEASVLPGEADRAFSERLVWLIGVPLSLLLFWLVRAMSHSRVRAIDIAESTAHRLQASEQQFHAVAETANDAILSANQKGDITYFNPAAERLYGYAAREVIGRSVMLLAHEEAREASRAAYERLVSGEAPNTPGRLYEAMALRKDGTAVPVELTVAKWRTAEGVFVTFIVRDVTIRREAEAAIRGMAEELERRVAERTAQLQHTLEEYERADQFRKSVMENAVMGLLTLDRRGHITMANKVFCELVQYDASELMNHHWSTLMSSEEALRTIPDVKRIITEQRSVVNHEVELIRKDGTVLCVVFGANPLIVRDEVVGAVAAVMDITKRKIAEAQTLRFNAELERRVRERTAELQAANAELESFTYSVSHDLRAPLRHINGHIQMLLEESSEDLDLQRKQRLLRIANAAVHMGQLIDDLLQFSRIGRSTLRRATVDMAAVVERAQNMLSNDVKGRTVEWEIGALPRVRCDENLIQQVWLNLLSNALKYSSSREVARIAVQARREKNEWVFSVRDNGVGFDMRYADKLFRLFERLHAGEFTGTGIGLASVNRIVVRHGGRAWAEGEVNRGATFYFTLPD